MRVLSLLAVTLAILVGCASSPRTDPIERQAPVLVASLAPPAATTPLPSVGDVAVGLGVGSRLSRGMRPHVRGELTAAGGNYRHDTDGKDFDFDDSAPSALYRLLLEISGPEGHGGGISIEGVGSDDRLFENDLDRRYQARISDTFLYYVYRGAGVGGDRFRIPLKAGLYLHGLELEDQRRDRDFKWGSLGIRVAASPKVEFIRTGRVAIEGFADLALGIHATGAEVDGVADDLATGGTTAGAEVGVRMVLAKHVSLGVSYLTRAVTYDKTSREDDVRLGDTESIFLGVLFSFGIRF
ncbi:MAG: hypothetical protein ACYS99_15965 [Planctomycetota bacterium]|jgi:hypothetical protein